MSPHARIPLVDLQAQFQTCRDAVLAAVARVFEHHQYVLGDEVTRFEAALAALHEVPPIGAIGVSSGTDALLAALMALGVGHGDRVITTPFSFFATAGTISRLGARPVFVDIDPATMNLDPERLEPELARGAKAVVAVHVFGRLAEIDRIRERTDPLGIPVIEDACQSIGVRDGKGRAAGLLGKVGCISFFPTKNLGGAGDGGALVTGDEDLARHLRLIRTHGAFRTYESEIIGGNFRIDALQAAVLAAKLPFLEGWNRARLANAALYDRLLRERGLDSALRLPPPLREAEWNAHQYVVRSKRRDELKTFLESRGIGTAIYYPQPFHRMGCFRDLGYAEGAFPEAEAACREALALPIFPELGEERIRRVVEAVGEFHAPR